MAEKKIYLIRHGQTDYNLKGIVQGSGVDTDLNETGRQQARAFYESYKDVPFRKIYISALKRTRQSVQQFIDNGIPAEVMKGLNEISWGSKDGQIVTADHDTFYRKMLDEWYSGNIDYKVEGGESPREVQKRLKEAFEVILSRKEEDTILICMHGRAMRILLATLFGQELKEMEQYGHHNLCLYVLNYNGSEFSVELFNSIEHLSTI